jgi:hypothetical protein
MKIKQREQFPPVLNQFDGFQGTLKKVSIGMVNV